MRPVGHVPESTWSLADAAAALYDDLCLSRILSRLLHESGTLLSVQAGSISLVDAAKARYTKAAERGARCRLGGIFPLDEGVTGRVVDGRRPVVLRRYSEIVRGHLPVSHAAAHGAVAAVPIWWRGEVLGVNVAFAGCDRAFSAAEVDRLEVLSQVGAAGIVSAAVAEPVLTLPVSNVQAESEPSPALVVTEVGTLEHRRGPTVAVAHTLVAGVEQALPDVRSAHRLRVVLLHQEDRLRVVLHDEAGMLQRTATTWHDLRRQWSAVVAPHGGTVHVERVPGWGVLVLADLPHAVATPRPSPLSRREDDVLQLLRHGLTDVQVADELYLSRKTVEKHVSAVLRKTGAATRTAAVVRALELGWLPAARTS